MPENEKAPRWFHLHESVPQELDEIKAQLVLILKNQGKIIAMSASNTNSLANLQAAVANETTIDQSVLALLTSLAAQIAAASPTGDNPAVDAVVATMTANAATLSAAVAANTTPAAPAAPAP